MKFAVNWDYRCPFARNAHEHLVEGLDAGALVARGFAAAVVDDVLRRVRTSEYKRRQMPPGLKITGKAFGPGRRYPIARAGD